MGGLTSPDRPKVGGQRHPTPRSHKGAGHGVEESAELFEAAYLEHARRKADVLRVEG
jgi:hypothetical protein